MVTTRVFKVDPRRPDPKAIRSCARVLKEGGLVAFPTETVYGLGASLLDKEAVKRIYAIKRRPRSKPLTVQVARVGMIEEMGVDIPPAARRLAKKFWPGPLTMILKAPSGRAVGFRIPKHAVALGLLREAGLPVAVPSANLSGEPPARDASAVLRDFGGKIEAVLDGGPSETGIESTVVDLTGRRPRIVRQGAIEKKFFKDI